MLARRGVCGVGHRDGRGTSDPLGVAGRQQHVDGGGAAEERGADHVDADLHGLQVQNEVVADRGAEDVEVGGNRAAGGHVCKLGSGCHSVAVGAVLVDGHHDLLVAPNIPVLGLVHVVYIHVEVSPCANRIKVVPDDQLPPSRKGAVRVLGRRVSHGRYCPDVALNRALVVQEGR